MNFNGVFRKNVSSDNIKSPKKQCFTLSLENTVFESPHGGGKIYTTAFLALI